MLENRKMHHAMVSVAVIGLVAFAFGQRTAAGSVLDYVIFRITFAPF
jgi:hypothetical protein